MRYWLALVTLALSSLAVSRAGVFNPAYMPIWGPTPTPGPSASCATFATYGTLDYCYPMNETSGYVLHDSSSADNNGTIQNQQYTSGDMTDQPNYSQVYGYFEARVQAPSQDSLADWPAVWLYCSKVTSNCANEFDFFEMDPYDGANNVDQEVQDQGPGCDSCYVIISPSPVPDQAYHRYGMLWTSTQVTFYLDGSVSGGPFNYAITTPMAMIIDYGIAGPSFAEEYQPIASDYPGYLYISGVWSMSQGSSGCGSTTLPTGTAALTASSYCINNVTYTVETPPTDNFDTFNQYNATTNPSGTWLTSNQFGYRMSGDSDTAFYSDNTANGGDVWPYETGSSGLTVIAQPAPQLISGFGYGPLASGDTGSLGTLGSTIFGGGAILYDYDNLVAGYAPVSGSFSLACYTEIPDYTEDMGTTAQYSIIGTNSLMTGGSPADEGFLVSLNGAGDLYFYLGYGSGITDTEVTGFSFATPQAIVLTYNNSTQLATVYVGATSSPASASVTLPAAYVASALDVRFNAGYFNHSNYGIVGGQYGPCAEWDGTVLTSTQIDAITGATV